MFDSNGDIRARMMALAIVPALLMAGPLVLRAEPPPVPVPASVPAFMTWLNPPHKPMPGVEHKSYMSRAMKTAVGYNIYLPPGYGEGRQRYPVVYWLHGRGGTENSSPVMAQILDQSIATGTVPPTILVFANGGAQSLYSDSFDGQYLSETTIIRELIPHVDKTYRTVARREGRSLQGMSMGGAGAMKLGLKFPDIFGSVAAFAGGYVEVDFLAAKAAPIFEKVFGGDRALFRANDPFELARLQAKKIKGRLPIKMYVGTADVSLDQSRQFHSYLGALKVAHEYIEIEGIKHSLTDLVARTKSDNFEFAARHFARRGAVRHIDSAVVQ